MRVQRLGEKERVCDGLAGIKHGVSCVRRSELKGDKMNAVYTHPCRVCVAVNSDGTMPSSMADERRQGKLKKHVPSKLGLAKRYKMN